MSNTTHRPRPLPRVNRNARTLISVHVCHAERFKKKNAQTSTFVPSIVVGLVVPATAAPSTPAAPAPAIVAATVAAPAVVTAAAASVVTGSTAGEAGILQLAAGNSWVFTLVASGGSLTEQNGDVQQQRWGQQMKEIL